LKHNPAPDKRHHLKREIFEFRRERERDRDRERTGSAPSFGEGFVGQRRKEEEASAAFRGV
jgi:hypothetical protein